MRPTFAARCRDFPAGCRPLPLITAVPTKAHFPPSQPTSTHVGKSRHPGWRQPPAALPFRIPSQEAIAPRDSAQESQRLDSTTTSFAGKNDAEIHSPRTRPSNPVVDRRRVGHDGGHLHLASLFRLADRRGSESSTCGSGGTVGLCSAGPGDRRRDCVAGSGRFPGHVAGEPDC